MAIDLNRNPYFEDYDEDKKFHRILYRPTYAVQARELTQQQTILQNQIAKFSDHIFKNGSMVIPGQVAFDQDIHYIKLAATFDGFEINEASFVGFTIQGLTSGAIARVILSSGVEGTDPKTFYAKYNDSGENDAATFIDGETLQIIDGDNSQCSVLGEESPETTNSTGLSSATSIESGVYYINSHFVIVDKQSLIIEKYDNAPSKKIGLQLYEYLVTPEDDNTLNDNAQGSYNYAAPGAHRYKLDLILEAYDVDSTVPADFIEIQRIVNGTIINEIRAAEYSELEKNLARRTFDESGNYTVRPFNINIKEHLFDETIPRLSDGKYLAEDGGDETKLAFGLEPGKAYVRGFERVKLATSWIDTNKARTAGNNNNSVTNFGIGQYIYISSAFRMPDFSIYDSIDLYDTTSTHGNTSGNIIGTAKVRAVELIDKNANASLSVYKLYLFDIKLNAGYAWSEVLWISSSDGGQEFTADTVVSSYPDHDKIIHEQIKKPSIFRLPHEYVKTLKIDSQSDTTYTVQRTYQNEGLSGGTIILTAGANQVFDTFNGLNYIVMDLNAALSDSADTFVPISVSTGNGGVSVTITPDDPSGITNVRIIIPVIKTISSEKTKSKQINHVFNIASPNTIPGQVDLLDHADGVKLSSVIMDPGGSDIDITDNYIFDDGQRDGFYDLARIKLKGSATPPSTDIRITYDYFTHGQGDFCSIDSYAGMDYHDVKAFYSETGIYELTDCIDFRPVIDTSGLSFTGSGGAYGEIPVPFSNVRCDYEHYLSRIDKLYIDYTGSFNIIQGTPAIVPAPPKSPDDGMVLFEIFMNAYSYSVKDARAKFIENKRYTMRDIGSLEKRINNIEYYTALSLLEKDTAQFQIQDGAGLDRFKNGFIVEPFNTHAIGDATNNDYKCAIDPVQEVMRPTFSSDSVDLEWIEDDSSNVVKTGPIVTLPYTDVSFISQNLASTTENINPFAVRTFAGHVTFQPDSDNWYDTEKNGTLVVNDDAHYEALQYIADNARGLNGIEWDDWQNNWSTTASATGSSWGYEYDPTRDHDLEGQVRVVTSTVAATTTWTGESRTGTSTSTSVGRVDKDLGDRTVGINYIPYMRSISVLVKVDGMKPNTTVYPFFDDISVTGHVVPAIKVSISSKTSEFNTSIGNEEIITGTGGASATIIYSSPSEIRIISWNGQGFASGSTVTGSKSGATAVLSESASYTSTSDQLVTDDSGRIGMVFTIPNSDTLRFRTGERIFFLSDQVNNTEANQTKAKGTFKSEGSMLQQEGTVLSTKTIRFNELPLDQARITATTSITNTTTTGAWFDPLAQTFLVEEEGGCFITKCDIYFQQKDSTLPANFQIREVVNGYPGQVIVPYSEVTLHPHEIAVSQDGSAATTFTMQAPVFLQQGAEYCFVLLSDSFDYNAWVGEIGQLDILSDTMISKQPYNGVLFKSQNASTWTANQQQDLKFVLYKAKFQVETSEGSGIPLIGSSILKNTDIGLRALNTSPLETFISSDVVRVHQKAHGFTNGSLVTLSGFSGTFNNISDTEINDSHILSNVENDSYTITVTTLSDDSGLTGGTTGYATKNISMDVVRPNVTELNVPGTSSVWTMKSTSSKSINGDQVPYVKSSIYDGVNQTENNFFLSPRMIASTENETAFIAGEKSLEFKNTIFSDNRNLSPVLDTNRLSAIAVSNVIDSATTIDGDYTITVSAGSNIISVDHTGHGMATGAVIETTASGTIGSITADELTGYFSITRADDDTYTFEVLPAGTPTSGSGSVNIVYSDSHYKYVPENISSGGTNAATYITRKITVEEPTIGIKLLGTAVVMDLSEFEIWYKIQGPYDTSLFNDLEWQMLTSPDTFVPLSENINDFRDYEYTKEFTEAEAFTSIAIKLVMKSTNSTSVPIFDNLRVICLGT